MKFYSHPATRQDEWLFKKVDAIGFGRGYFVELGAHNGVHHSNTLALEVHKVWNGMLVEADPLLYQQMHQNRPQCLSVHAVVGTENAEEKEFVFGNSYGGLVEFMPVAWMEEHKRRENRVGMISTTTLHNLLTTTQAPSVIDYLSLNIEGAELPVLRKFFDEMNEPEARPFIMRMLTVEFRYDQMLLDSLTDLLTSKGYELDCVQGFDAFYTHRTHGRA
jgi:FkbM family methyltransferase